MDTFDKFLNDRISNDPVKLEANQAIFDQLKYHAILTNSSCKAKQNSIIPSLAGMLSIKFLAWKLSFAALLLVSFMGYQQMNSNTNIINSNDTAQAVYNLDTLNTIYLKDSICN